MCFSFSLRLFQKFDTFRILVCGGDGSVGWVLSEIDALTLHKQVCTVDLVTNFSYVATLSQDYSCTMKINTCFVAVVSVGSSSSGDWERSGQGSGLGVRLRRRHSAAADSGEVGESQHQDVRQVAGRHCV